MSSPEASMKVILPSLVASAVLLMAGVGPGLAQAPAAKRLNKLTGDPQAIQEGRALFIKYGCSGCHGVGGGGGMAVAVIDDRWKFGSDDETLFKLIKGQIPEAKMPKVFAAIPDEEVWKMLAYVRAKYVGDPKKVDW